MKSGPLRHRIRMAGKALRRSLGPWATPFLGGGYGSGFDAAAGSGRWPAWASQQSPIRMGLAARQRLSSEAAYLVANSPAAASIVDCFVTNLVADGPSARSGHPSPAVRRALQAAWNRFWSICDVEGVSGLGGLLDRLVRSLVVSGEAFVHLVPTPHGLRLRLLATEQIDQNLNRNLDDGGVIVAGVEIGPDGARRAYHVRPNPEGPFGVTLPPTVRIPAEDICHVYEPQTPGSVRGISWLTPALTRLLDLYKLEDALLARMQTAALFGAFVAGADTGGFSDATPRAGNQAELSLEPGVLRFLPDGSTIEFPQVPGIEGAPELLKHMLRSIAAGVGVPYSLMTGDLADVNYSSSKVGIENFKRRLTAIRATMLGSQLLEPIWRRFVLLELLSGRINAPDFERDADSYFAVTIQWPVFASLDPYRETQADIAALNAGLVSRAQIIAARGRDIEDVDREIAADPRPAPALAAPGATTFQENQNAAA